MGELSGGSGASPLARSGVRADGQIAFEVVFRPSGGVMKLISGLTGGGKTYGEIPVLLTIAALQARPDRHRHRERPPTGNRRVTGHPLTPTWRAVDPKKV